MIDIKLIRQNIDVVKESLKKRNSNIDIEQIKDLDKKYRENNIKVEELNSKKNILVKNISSLISSNEKSKAEKIKLEVKEINSKIQSIEENTISLKEELDNLLLAIPNIPFDDVPYGADENDNVEIRKHLEPTKFDFEYSSHWNLGEKRDFIDLKAAAKISGSRFSIYKNKGALLMNALQQFTIEKHINSGYQFFIMPLIINSKSLVGTGQLPKFKEDLFKLEEKNYFLSPTLEVQLTNYYSNSILDKSQLPLKVTASSLNFRSEAGATGKDIKGVIRQHQFLKTEMVNICHPNDSAKLLEEMVKQAESLLRDLEIPFRTILLCTGDMGFSSKKTYDIEVWMPSYNSYKEISSCSNCGDFQARRAKIRIKENNENILANTLNGSGLALDRLWAAVIENYQQKDGSILVPKVLRKYLPYEKI